MQAEIPPTVKRSNFDEQAAQVATCPLCQTPLVRRDAPSLSSTPTMPQQTFVMCPSCGYSAPAIQRQHRMGQPATPANRRQPTGSSVWIDPTVSAYLGSNEPREYSPSPVQPVSPLSPMPPVPPAQKKPIGGTAHPIPQRASAQPVKVRPKYVRTSSQLESQDNDVTRIPTLPPPSMWQYESSQFEAESSLPSLSLVVDADVAPDVTPQAPMQSVVQALPQQPISGQSLLEAPLPMNALATPPASPMQKKQHITDIDEIDTLPSALVQLSPSATPGTAPRQLSPAIPRQLSPASPASPRVSNIDEFDTLPPGSSGSLNANATQRPQHISDLDRVGTFPPMVVPGVAPTTLTTPVHSSGLVPVRPASMQVHAPLPHVVAASAPTEQVVSLSGSSSWTAGGVHASAYARRIADPSRERKQTPQMQPLDHLRWWLLHPGRLEGLLWMGGTLLLLLVTFSFLIVTAVSLSWIAPGTQGSSVSSLTTTDTNPTSVPTMITTHGLTLILENAGPIVPGQIIQLRGQGFSPRGQITFVDENKQPLTVQGNPSNAVQADEHGTFAVTLLTSAWQAGTHHIVVHDVVSGRTADLPLVLASGPFGKNATPTASASKTATPTTATPVGGTIPTAVSSTPPVTTPPTITPIAPSPTPTQVKPTPTPTMGVTPTSTPGTTPTAGTTPSPSPTTSSSSSNLTTAGVASLPNVNTLSPWVWLLIAGYSLSMLMLGLAGVLLKRR